jgi:phosphate transport system permease protein
MKDHIAPFFGADSTGLSVFTASIVLAVMVFPIMISICAEAFAALSHNLRESSLSLGTTKWQTIKKVLLRASFPGIVASVLLGFGRAFGETMAVLMVIGNIPTMNIGLFDAAATIPSHIAANYGDLQASPTGESAILLAALFLFAVVAVFNILARVVLMRIERRWGG